MGVNRETTYCCDVCGRSEIEPEDINLIRSGRWHRRTFCMYRGSDIDQDSLLKSVMVVTCSEHIDTVWQALLSNLRTS